MESTVPAYHSLLGDVASFITAMIRRILSDRRHQLVWGFLYQVLKVMFALSFLSRRYGALWRVGI